MIPVPTKLYVYAAAAIALFGAGAFSAYRVQEWRYKAMAADRVDQERETAVMRRKAANNASTGHEQDKVRIQTEFVTIEKEVNRVVDKIEYRDRACFDDDGLRVLNSAIRLTGSASEPSNTVPAAE